MKNTLHAIALVIAAAVVGMNQSTAGSAATEATAVQGAVIPVGEVLVGQKFRAVSSSGERQLFTKTIDGGSFIVAFNEETMATQLFLPTQLVLVREVL